METKFIFSVEDFAYTLFQRPDFPAMLIANRLCVRGDKFDAWVDQQSYDKTRR